jgi:Phage holin family Hol44, in holin superfamily V
MDFTQEFLPYLGLAVILWAIRETQKVDNKWIPIIAVLLGVLYAFWEFGGVNPLAFLKGLQYALLGVGSVAAVKYFLETHKPYK